MSSTFSPEPISIAMTMSLPSNNTSILSNYGGTVMAALILTLAFLIGIPGNLFVVWSIMARTQRRSVTTTLILNLACADGMVMVLTPFFIAYLIQRTWIFGENMCKILYYFCCANMYASIFLIMLMSLHRLVAVVWPQRLAAFSTRKTVMRSLFVLWILALGLAVPAFAFRKVAVIENRSVCDCLHEENKYAVMQYCMETVLGFLLPYSLILVSYTRVLLRIRRTRFQRRIRSEKLILIIVGTFALFWLPYHVVNMLQVSEELLESSGDKIHNIRTSLRPIVASVAFVSSCINPILYTYIGKAYIQRAGLGFMARLFEATAREAVSRKSHNFQLGENDGLRDKESGSSTTAHASINPKASCVQNEKP